MNHLLDTALDANTIECQIELNGMTTIVCHTHVEDNETDSVEYQLGTKYLTGFITDLNNHFPYNPKTIAVNGSLVK